MDFVLQSKALLKGNKMLVVIHVTTFDGIVVQKIQQATNWDDAYDKATGLVMNEGVKGKKKIRKDVEDNCGYDDGDWAVVITETE